MDRQSVRNASRPQSRWKAFTVCHDQSYPTRNSPVRSAARNLLERASSSNKRTEGEPVMIRRAKATAWILDHVQISIRDDELIAGNRTIKPRAGIMSPEMDPYWLLNELDGSRPARRTASPSAKKISASTAKRCSPTGKNAR
jgi:formate C-acetyltransferase